MRVVNAAGGKTFASAYTPSKTRKHEATVRLYAQQAMAGRQPTAHQVRLTVIQVFAVPASWARKARQQALAGTLRPTVKPDWDNIAKSVSDAINGVVYLDDKQVVSARVEKWYGPQPELEVVAETLEATPATEHASSPEQLVLGLAK